MAVMHELSTIEAHNDRVWAIDWYPLSFPSNVYFLASCSSDRTIKIWSIQLITVFEACVKQSFVSDKEHSRAIRSISWALDGYSLAAASFDGTVSVWKVQIIPSLNNMNSPQIDLVLSDILEGHQNEVKSVAWSTNCNLLATCSRDKTIWVWDRDTSTKIMHKPELVQHLEIEDNGDEINELDDEFECAAVLTGHSQDIKSIIFVPNEHTILSSSYDNSIKQWNESTIRTDNWQCTQTFYNHESTVWYTALATIPDITDSDLSNELLLASCSADQTVVISRRSGTVWSTLHTFKDTHTGPIYHVDWSPVPLVRRGVHSRILVSCSGDSALGIYTIERQCSSNSVGNQYSFKTWLKYKTTHEMEINSVKFAPVPSQENNACVHSKCPLLLASCSDDGCIKLMMLDVSTQGTS